MLLSLFLAWILGLSLRWNTTAYTLSVGAIAALPLLTLNHLLWRWSLRNPDSIYAHFSNDVVVPLCKRLSATDALLIGALSGIGEEMLFRGALNQIIIRWGGESVALILTSLAFAYVHFVGNMKRFGGMVPLYTAVGVLLWVLWRLTDSLAAVAVTHGIYNTCAIVLIRRLSTAPAGNEYPPPTD